MNTDMLYATLRDDVVLINVHFNAPALYVHNDGTGSKTYIRSTHTANGTTKKYSYKGLKSMGLASGDAVVVTVNDGELKVVQVAEVLDINSVEDTKTEMKWVVGRVDRDAVDRVLQQEESFRTTIQTAQIAKHRREALADLAANNGVDASVFAQFDGMQHLGGLLAGPSAEKSVIEG